MTLARNKVSIRREYWIPGLYSITNIVNGHRYIGSSNNLYRRLYQHLNSLRKNKHPNKHLQSAWNKYGEENFLLQGICDCDREDLLVFEQVLIDIYKPEYNKARIAGSTKGLIFSNEHKRKLSLARKKRIVGIGGEKYVGRIVESPNGQLFSIYPSLQEFCKIHSLDSSVMSKILRKIPRYKSHRGWTRC